MADFRITVTDNEDDNGREVVDRGLGAYNRSAASLDAVRLLNVIARSPDGDVLGGAVGRTWGTCCELLQIWVAENSRRDGLGTQLMNEFETTARDRGCTTCYLDTFSFQAPEFYRRLGYSTVAEFTGFAPGVSKLVMSKLLAKPSPASE